MTELFTFITNQLSFGWSALTSIELTDGITVMTFIIFSLSITILGYLLHHKGGNK